MRHCACFNIDCPQAHRWDVDGPGYDVGEIPHHLANKIAKAEAEAIKAHEDWLASLMSEAQINSIRTLFNEVRNDLSISDQEKLIKIMKAHIAGKAFQKNDWAEMIILRLRNRKYHKWENRRFVTQEEAQTHMEKMGRGAIKLINPPTQKHKWVWSAKREESIFS